MHVVVVGGGIGGLATALILGRQGHRVTVVDRDGMAPAADVDAAFGADRRGAPQTRHTHGFLARLVLELRHRLPDIHDELVAAGAVPLPLTRAFADDRPGDEDLVVLTMRRSTVEWVLRRRAAESSVELCSDRGVTGLRAKPGEAAGGAPTITGVELDDGTALDADVVVLATGRRGPVPAWLAAVGADVPEEVHESGLVYLSRWYRRPGGFAVHGEAKAGGDHGFLKYLAIPGDGDVASITLALRTSDAEMRALLANEDRFDAAAALFEGARALFDQGDVEPVTDVLPMGGLINRRRRFLAPDGQPVALGLHAVGDAHTCTNPLYGRGCSLAVVQAGLLADAIAAHPAATADDADARARAYEAACTREVVPWFEISVQSDAMGSDPNGRNIAATGTDAVAESAAHDANRAIARVFAAGGQDPVVGRGLMRLMNLLATPSDLMADPEFTAQAMTILGDPDTYPVPPPPPGPTRTELLALLSA
ncbi:FAD-dependent oxidoreductase [Iamia sp. SCSIO 61187]|uniref:NAD(P)/FAD-dependent oxidoreductase n=1 Tax=Iamia sp. SCSIO 61187 TaxID=2722752 RepID=UPI001C62FAEF|nr:FAD-dependent oxidoreductase [Iamia sp. SCSIO 61187]QYG93289.1 FAD-dependent oxidoreductase [Iamia sp. SCSIO 61187]